LKKSVFLKKVEKSGDSKCLGDWEKSFVELPDAKQFLRIRGERVFQQPRGFPTLAYEKQRNLWPYNENLSAQQS
jgi:hypothetical protein